MKRAAAIVTDQGGRTSHAAIVSRELGIPAIVGAENATKILKQDQAVTVSCAEGDKGHVYDGKLQFETKDLNLEDVPETKTQIMLNIGTPRRPCAGGNCPAKGWDWPAWNI
ncbi:MAG: PEP-utilizing enzyme [Desulfotignum sp.]|nr:PEP-utilizing enzyme [Desulfotignum sp.]